MRGPAYSSFPIISDAKRGQFYDQKHCAGDLGRYPSGQRGQTVNLLPSASKVRILACPPKQAIADGSAGGFEQGVAPAFTTTSPALRPGGEPTPAPRVVEGEGFEPSKA